MADTSGQALIRGINLDKKARNYQNEESIFYKEVNVQTSSSREIRYQQRTSGYLTATSPASIVIAEGSTPFVLETSWTRNTSYTKKYSLDSPMITIEDEKDSEVKVFMDNLEEITGRSEEHTSELQSHSFISYAVFCLKKKKEIKKKRKKERKK